jgi:hypothetical protein
MIRKTIHRKLTRVNSFKNQHCLVCALCLEHVRHVSAQYLLFVNRSNKAYTDVLNNHYLIQVQNRQKIEICPI